MIIIFLLIPLSIVIATAFLGAFIWAVRSGQYEDTFTPSMRMLLQEPSATDDSRSSAVAGQVAPSLASALIEPSENRAAISPPKSSPSAAVPNFSSSHR